MLMPEFIATYCQDLLKEVNTVQSLFDLSDLPHDYTIKDSEGNTIPVVNVDGHDIPVLDFITLTRKDFIAYNNTPDAPEAYDNYIESIELIEGPEVLTYLRNAISAEAARLEKEEELMPAWSSL